ncbi:MAG TPA: DUF2062 domain-containing protein [Kiritimatiellia bacterium]|nr:DUF2062 domain-containing protein [Kiritimatiellia bacterium]
MSFLRKVTDPIINLLREGVTPERIAVSVIIGCLIGIIPVLGVATALCTVIALPLRLNLVAMQAVNWLIYPVQLLLLIPFYRAGEKLFNATPLGLMPSEIIDLFKSGTWNAIVALWDTTVRAVVVWGLAALLVAPALYLLLVPILRRTMRRQQTVAVPA